MSAETKRRVQRVIDFTNIRWSVTNQDGKPLPDLRGAEWDQISGLRYFIAGEEVGSDEFDAFLEKWRTDNAEH
jgi:hypothetical protein